MRIRVPQILGAALALVMAGSLGACANPPANYTTQLDRTGGLGPGDPVIHGSATIGQVTTISPIPGGDTEVAFQVSGANTNDVHQDAIMLLSTQPGTPSLEVMNQDAMSSPAPAGMRLDGASDMYQAQMIMMSRGPGSLATALTNTMTAFPNSNASTPSSSPATIQMQRMLGQITQQTASMAMAMSPPNQASLARMQSDAEAVERQFTRNGKPQQADRVHQEMDQILTGYGVSVTPAPPAP